MKVISKLSIPLTLIFLFILIDVSFGKTVISYQLPVFSNVDLQIYNILGQKVVTLVSEKQPEGTYKLEWNGRNSHGQQVSSGIYFYRLRADKFHQTKKMILLQ